MNGKTHQQIPVELWCADSYQELIYKKKKKENAELKVALLAKS